MHRSAVHPLAQGCIVPFVSIFRRERTMRLTWQTQSSACALSLSLSFSLSLSRTRHATDT